MFFPTTEWFLANPVEQIVQLEEALTQHIILTEKCLLENKNVALNKIDEEEQSKGDIDETSDDSSREISLEDRCDHIFTIDNEVHR